MDDLARWTIEDKSLTGIHDHLNPLTLVARVLLLIVIWSLIDEIIKRWSQLDPCACV